MRVYHIFVDRFSTGSGLDDALAYRTSKDWMGGTLDGIQKHLDYIAGLGFEAILLSPINKAESYHGYDVIDPFKVDERFGGDTGLSRLVKDAHDSSLEVILDFVANHVSHRNQKFVEAKNNERSPYRNWFYFDGDGRYKGFMGFDGMPKLNLKDGGAKDYVLRAAEHWISDFDIDGYRLDSAIRQPKNFWKELVSQCRRDKPGFVFLPEIWLGSVNERDFEDLEFFDEHEKEKLLRLQDGRLNDDPEQKVWNVYVNKNVQRAALDMGMEIFGSVLDFEKNFMIRSSLIYGRPLEIRPEPGRYAFLDNHDMQRIAWLAKSKDRLLDSIRLISSFPDMTWYYGTEIAMTQDNDFSAYSSFADTEARRFMKWNLSEEEASFLSNVKGLISNRVLAGSL